MCEDVARVWQVSQQPVCSVVYVDRFRASVHGCVLEEAPSSDALFFPRFWCSDQASTYFAHIVRTGNTTSPSAPVHQCNTQHNAVITRIITITSIKTTTRPPQEQHLNETTTRPQHHNSSLFDPSSFFPPTFHYLMFRGLTTTFHYICGGFPFFT